MMRLCSICPRTSVVFSNRDSAITSIVVDPKIGVAVGSFAGENASDEEDVFKSNLMGEALEVGGDSGVA